MNMCPGFGRKPKITQGAITTLVEPLPISSFVMSHVRRDMLIHEVHLMLTTLVIQQVLDIEPDQVKGFIP